MHKAEESGSLLMSWKFQIMKFHSVLKLCENLSNFWNLFLKFQWNLLLFHKLWNFGSIVNAAHKLVEFCVYASKIVEWRVEQYYRVGGIPLINGDDTDVHKRTNVVLCVILLLYTGSRSHQPWKTQPLTLWNSVLLRVTWPFFLVENYPGWADL